MASIYKSATATVSPKLARHQRQRKHPRRWRYLPPSCRLAGAPSGSTISPTTRLTQLSRFCKPRLERTLRRMAASRVDDWEVAISSSAEVTKQPGSLRTSQSGIDHIYSASRLGHRRRSSGARKARTQSQSRHLNQGRHPRSRVQELSHYHAERLRSADQLRDA